MNREIAVAGCSRICVILNANKIVTDKEVSPLSVDVHKQNI